MNLVLKGLSTSAVIAAMAVSGNAMADSKPTATLYGKAHLSLASVSADDGTDDGSATQIKSNSSRLGVKGSYDVEDGLKVTYKVEWQVNMADNAKSSEDHIKGRNQYVGLAGGFGEVRVGRHDTAYKLATGKFDLYGDTYIDYNNIIDKSEDKREDNTIFYTMKADALNLAASYTLDSTTEDTAAEDSEGDILSLGLTYKAGALLLAGGYQSTDEGHSAMKFGAAYSLNEFTFGGVFEQVDTDDDNADESNILLMGKYKISDSNCIKLLFGQKDIDEVDDDPTMIGLGFDHKFNKNATFYALVGNGSDGGMDDAGGLEGDSTAISLGMIVKF